VKETRSRPVNLDLTTIQFPLTAIASILHRISGVVVFIGLGWLLWLLNVSLSSEEGFFWITEEVLVGFWAPFLLWGILVALFYHVTLGIRHLLMDFGWFEEMASGTRSVQVGFLIVAILAIVAGALVW
jgi:succinate dehydrogenase / fumarate reductase cytochrome b subunit